MEVKLTTAENELFNLLSKFTKANDLNTVLRVAGGWVRDKILGLQSSDIDIALDDCTGNSFCQKLSKWLETEHPEIPIKVIILSAKPELSKHLETARASISGLEIDFVNLRTESYAETSRCPISNTFGTALEDALRRDFTINSMFYNLNTREVEDITGQGIQDLLTNRLIRTPVDPKITFSDDPLRGIRAIRFAARYSFTLEPAIEEVLSSDAFLEQLEKKVSYDRVTKELMSMIEGNGAFEALSLLERFNLWDGFLLSDNKEDQETHVVSDTTIPSDWRKVGLEILSNYEKLRCNFKEEYNWANEAPNERIGHVMSAFMWSLRDINVIVKEVGSSKQAREMPLTKRLLFRMRLPTLSAYCCVGLQKTASSLPMKQPVDQLSLGLSLLLAEKCWRHGVILAVAATDPSIDVHAVFADIQERSLEDICSRKPHFNGKQVLDVLKNIPKGPSMKLVMEKQQIFQIQFPSSTKDKCASYLQSEFPEWN